MADPFSRGSAPGRARDASERPGSFKHGHKKLGGRKKGTPNLMSADYKDAVLGAAYRVGNDGNGKDGFVGYLRYVAVRCPNGFVTLLCRIIDIQEAYPEQPSLTMDEINARIRASTRIERRAQDGLMDVLMNAAIKEPKEFCKVLVALLPRPRKRRLRAHALS